MIGEHRIHQAEQDGKIVGYSVLSINRQNKDYPSGQIVDLLTLPDKPDIADSLMDEAIKYFLRNGVNVAGALTVAGHPYSKVFRQWGFVETNAKVHVGYIENGIEDEVDRLTTGPASSVFVCFGDISI
jgi:hypothetical protein